MDGNNIKIKLPEQVAMIISRLEEAGYEAYAVGGCVRDSILGRRAADWDITTSALPEEVKKLFRRTIDTGIEHGTVTVLIDEPEKKPIHKKIYESLLMEIRASLLEKEGGHFGDEEDTSKEKNADKGIRSYEVTTFRLDGKYIDGRHPESVSFTRSLKEDLARRDFTVNAMAWNDRTGLVDLFGGLEDLDRGLIRCVGVPAERFEEDALRLLRAVRFSAQLGFEIEEETKKAIAGHGQMLSKVSVERIYQELSKLVCSAHINKLRMLFELGLAAHMGEGLTRMHLDHLDELVQFPMEARHRYDLQKSTNLSHRYIRYAYAFMGMQEADIKTLLKSLKADNDTIRGASLLAARLLEPLPSERYEIKKYMSAMDPVYFEDLLEMKLNATHTKLYREYCGGEDIHGVLRQYNDFMRREEPVYMKDLVVKGADLIRAGVPEGPEVGRMLEEMLDEVQRYPIHNSLLYLISQFLSGRSK